MKKAIILSVLLTAFLLLNTGLVSAQTAETISWNASTYYQGGNGAVSVTIYNSHNYQICTKQFYIQFDWQKSQNAAFMSSTTPCIATGQNYTFNLQFDIPSSLSVGTHFYNITWVDAGYLLGRVVVSSSSLYIHDAYEKVYMGLVSQVQSAITQAQNANYTSPTARADLNQAVSLYTQATSLASQGQFQSAVSTLNQVPPLLTQASSAQATYQPPLFSSGGQSGSNSNSFVLLLVVIVVVLAYLYLKERGKKHSTKRE